MKDDERTRAGGIIVLVENELLVQIQNVYEDVTTTAQTKRRERKIITEVFIGKYSKMLDLPEDKVRSIVYTIIEKTKWIREIEESDGEVDDDDDQKKPEDTEEIR